MHDQSNFPRRTTRNDRRNDRRIDHWITLQRVVNVINKDWKLPLKLSVIIEQPKFTDGERGFSRINMTIGVGDYYVKLATKATMTLLDLLTEYRSDILKAVDDVREMNQELKEEQDQRNDDRRRRSKDIPVAKEDYPLLTDDSLDFRKTTRQHGNSGRSRSYHPNDRRKRSYHPNKNKNQ